MRGEHGFDADPGSRPREPITPRTDAAAPPGAASEVATRVVWNLVLLVATLLTMT